MWGALSGEILRDLHSLHLLRRLLSARSANRLLLFVHFVPTDQSRASVGPAHQHLAEEGHVVFTAGGRILLPLLEPLLDLPTSHSVYCARPIYHTECAPGTVHPFIALRQLGAELDFLRVVE